MREILSTTTSDTFVPTGTIISTTPSGKTYNVKDDIKELLPTKDEGGLIDFRSDDIADWFGDINFTDDTTVSGEIKLLKKTMAHKEIIAEGKKIGIYEEYEIGPTLLLVKKAIKSGEIKKGQELTVYLKNRRSKRRCRLSVYHVSGTIRVDVHIVCLKKERHVDDGVLFKS